MSKSWAYIVDGEGQARHASNEEATEAVGKAHFVWIHLYGRDEGSLPWLAKQKCMPKTALAALAAMETRPRGDTMDGGAIVNLRGLGSTPDDDPDSLVSIRLWAADGLVVSVSFRTLAGIDEVCDQAADGEILDPGDLIVALAHNITNRLDPEVAALGDVADELEGHIENCAIYGARARIAEVRSVSIDYRRFLQPQRNALERLSVAELAWLTDDDRLHLREAADRAARMAEEVEAIRERSALLHEQLTDLRTEQIDQRSLLVAIIALIFLPLTFVTGLFGMNVDGIPMKDNPSAFWLISAGCCVFGLLLWLAVSLRRWV